jgi:hypothetical protein
MRVGLLALSIALLQASLIVNGKKDDKQDQETFIVSFPKVGFSKTLSLLCFQSESISHLQSGRTWLRLMVGYALNEYETKTE